MQRCFRNSYYDEKPGLSQARAFCILKTSPFHRGNHDRLIVTGIIREMH